MSEIDCSCIDYKRIPTGLKNLDRYLGGGLASSSVTLIACRPGMGKTSLVLSIASNIPVLTGKSVVYFTMNTKNKEISQKLLSVQSGVKIGRIMNNKLNKDELEKIIYAINHANIDSIYLCDRVMNVKNIAPLCGSISNLGMVIIDGFRWVSDDKYTEESTQHQNMIMRDIMNIAMTLNVPVILTAIIPRINEHRKNMRPKLSDFDLLTYKAFLKYTDVVLLLHREYYFFNTDNNDPCLAECIIDKNRTGDCGTVYLHWDYETLRFKDWGI